MGDCKDCKHRIGGGRIAQIFFDYHGACAKFRGHDAITGESWNYPIVGVRYDQRYCNNGKAFEPRT